MLMGSVCHLRHGPDLRETALRQVSAAGQHRAERLADGAKGADMTIFCSTETLSEPRPVISVERYEEKMRRRRRANTKKQKSHDNATTAPA